MTRKKPDAPLEWLKRSVWAGESPPEELDTLEAMLEEAEAAPPAPKKPGKQRKKA